MVSKIRTTVYLSASVKRSIDINIRNFSAWVENRVISEFGVALSLIELDREITEHEVELARLRIIRSSVEPPTSAPL